PSGLDAALVVNHQRGSHRERVQLALDHASGAGEIQSAGVSASVCSGIQTDREFSVFAKPMRPGQINIVGGEFACRSCVVCHWLHALDSMADCVLTNGWKVAVDFRPHSDH
ncbi:MAG TPA: hypothetical protein VHI72_08690, partial [Hyphomicrobiaceae bacterium]|nr:hypothetical protein [Hyphomicrobiaceae bacterium]